MNRIESTERTVADIVYSGHGKAIDQPAATVKFEKGCANSKRIAD